MSLQSWTEAHQSHRELSERLNAATTPAELVALYADANRLLHDLQAIVGGVGDTRASELQTGVDSTILLKSQIVKTTLSIGALPLENDAPPELLRIVARFSARIICDDTKTAFFQELDMFARDAHLAFEQVSTLRRQIAQLETKRELLTHYHSLLNALVSAGSIKGEIE